MKKPDLSKEDLEAWKKQVQNPPTKNPPIRHIKLGGVKPGLPKDLIAETKDIRDGQESHINKARRDLAGYFANFARLIDEKYHADANRINAIETRIGIDLAPYRAADWEKASTDEDRAKLRAYVENPGRIDEIIEILLEIGTTNG